MTQPEPAPPNLDLLRQYQQELRDSFHNHDLERVFDLCQIIKTWEMNKTLLRQTKFIKDIQKLTQLSHEPLTHCVKGILKDWNDIWKEEGPSVIPLSSTVVNSSRISLEDYFEIDLPTPNNSLRFTVPPPPSSHYEKRVHIIKGTPPATSRPIVYWMSRDQRLHDNWALLYAQQRAIETNSTLCIIFGLTSNFPGANIRSYGFMLRGLKLLQLECENFNIPFFLLRGSPEEVVTRFCSENQVGTLVTDFSPLRLSKQWKENISSHTADDLFFVEVCCFDSLHLPHTTSG
jgi:hypothetical protein